MSKSTRLLLWANLGLMSLILGRDLWPVFRAPQLEAQDLTAPSRGSDGVRRELADPSSPLLRSSKWAGR